MLVPPALVWSAVLLATAQKNDQIQHEKLADSSNATRVFCVKIDGATENSLIQPTVLLEFNGDSRQLPLLQSNTEPTVFRGTITFEGPGLVEYIITAGTAFWTPQNSSVASFRQLEGRTIQPEKVVAAEQENHTVSHNDTSAMFYVFVVFFVLLFVFMASVVLV